MNFSVNDDKGITIEMFNQKKLLNVKKNQYEIMQDNQLRKQLNANFSEWKQAQFKQNETK